MPAASIAIMDLVIGEATRGAQLQQLHGIAEVADPCASHGLLPRRALSYLPDRGNFGTSPRKLPAAKVATGEFRSTRTRSCVPGCFAYLPATVLKEANMTQSAGLHEPEDKLTPETIDRHRAIVAIQEELEAIDWYDQRVAATNDPELAAVLAHNRDEEKEHAAMTLEWLRRHDPVLDRHLRTYLFTTAPVTEIEAEAESGASGSDEPGTASSAGSFGIGGLKGESL